MHVLLVSNGHWSIPDSAFEAWAAHVSRAEGGFENPQPEGGVEPDVVFVGPCPETVLLSAVASLKRTYPKAAIVPFVPAPSPDLLLELLRSGTSDVLTSEAPEAIHALVQRVASSGAAKETQPSAPHAKQRRIGFISVKGGVGGTVLLANLGIALAESGQARVLMVDLTLPFGDLDIYLTTKQPEHDLADLAGEVDRLDPALFKAMVHHVNDKVDLIPCPQGVERVLQINPAAVSRLIDVVAPTKDVALLDFGSSIDPVKLPLLEGLDQLVIIAMLDVPNARHTSQLLELLKGLDFPLTKTSLVINRHSAAAPITQDELEEAVGRPVDRTIADAGLAISDSLAQGMPVIAAQPRSAFSAEISSWASELLGLPQKRKSLWARLRNK